MKFHQKFQKQKNAPKQLLFKRKKEAEKKKTDEVVQKNKTEDFLRVPFDAVAVGIQSSIVPHSIHRAVGDWYEVNAPRLRTRDVYRSNRKHWRERRR